jgi:hypothetical protein
MDICTNRNEIALCFFLMAVNEDCTPTPQENGPPKYLSLLLWPIKHQGEDFSSPVVILAVHILNPPHSFLVADLSKVKLGCRKIDMPQDDFADNLYRCARPGCICCSVSSKIMRAQLYANQFPGFLHNVPGCYISDRKYPLGRLCLSLQHVLMKAVCQLFRKINNFSFTATLWFS